MENYESKGVNRGIIERIKEIYEETENFVRTGKTLTEQFWTAKRVRSTKLNIVHNVCFGDGRGI